MDIFSLSVLDIIYICDIFIIQPHGPGQRRNGMKYDLRSETLLLKGVPMELKKRLLSGAKRNRQSVTQFAITLLEKYADERGGK